MVKNAIMGNLTFILINSGMLFFAGCQSHFIDYRGQVGDYFPAHSIFTVEVPKGLALNPGENTPLNLEVMVAEHDGIQGLRFVAVAHIAEKDSATQKRYAFVEIHSLRSDSSESDATALATLPSGEVALPLVCNNEPCTSFSLPYNNLTVIIEENVALEGHTFKISKGMAR